MIICIQNNWDIRLAFLCDINLEKFPKSTVFAHPFAISIRENTVIGEHVEIRQCTTIGLIKSTTEQVVIGNNVSLGANVLVLGNVIIHDNVKIGAGAIVLKDVPPDTTVTGLWK